MKIQFDTRWKSRGMFVAFLAATIVALWQFANSVDAKEAATALIDADWENCLRNHMEKRLFTLISASDEQKKTLDTLFHQRMEESRPDREKLRNGVIELARLFESRQASNRDIEDKAQELRTLHDKIADERLKTALKVRDILTPEQREILSERVVERIAGNGKYFYRRYF
jgi:Spy/CpxP family protein refolding chaperone